jgi:hypothetical protein
MATDVRQAREEGMSLQDRARQFLDDFNASLEPRQRLRRGVLARQFMRELTDCLIAAPRAEIETWPSPFSNDTAIEPPSPLAKFAYRACRDRYDDGTIAVVVICWHPSMVLWQRVDGDGFYVAPDGVVTRFTQEDVYRYT